ncbi:MAG TPA: sigma 54-interacting transcriptional regulator [Gemmatimonadales bacterium]|nr:sigma 54-interacting transcriptional regulator [Gemmatimonadales bacterium]
MVSPSILGDAPLIYASEAFRKVLKEAERAAVTDLPVLLVGESGTGKARIARIIHEMSPRRAGPCQVWSAAEVPSSIAASALFGVTKGAFTGAVKDVRGIIESAAGGTLVLDDVDKLDSSVQLLLLRFLDDLSVRRIGTTVTKRVDVRLIFTTNQNLQQQVRQGRFLADLAYRLNGLRIEIPPLRSRPQDIAPLVEHLVTQYAQAAHLPVPLVSGEALAILQGEPWHGNVRELASVIQNLVLNVASNGCVTPEEARVAIAGSGEVNDNRVKEELTRLRGLPERLRKSPTILKIAMELTDGNGREAAKALGLPERTFRRHAKKHGLTTRRFISGRLAGNELEGDLKT